MVSKFLEDHSVTSDSADFSSLFLLLTWLYAIFVLVFGNTMEGSTILEVFGKLIGIHSRFHDMGMTWLEFLCDMGNLLE